MRWWLTFLLLWLFAMQAYAQHPWRGIVLDGERIIQLEGVKVYCGNDSAVTNEEGVFALPGGKASATAEFSLPGYRSRALRFNHERPFSTVYLYPSSPAAEDSSYPYFGAALDRVGRVPVSVNVHQNETYDKVVENTFQKTLQNPFSAFPLNVNHASYSNVRRFILRKEPVPPAVVRIEELVNYFPYRYQPVSRDSILAVHSELATCPWMPGHWLMAVSVQAYQIPADSLPPNNLVLVVDISGSMEASNKLPLLKVAFRQLVSRLDSLDKIAVVIYSGNATLALPPTPGHEKKKILDVINNLNAGGSTAGSAGIEEAFRIARQHYLPQGNNRVILATDGDFNVGKSTNTEMQHLIAQYHDWGIYLTCIGVGAGNYKDSKLETLSRWGQGNFVYLDNPEEAERLFSRGEYAGTLYTLARKAGIKVIFNPSVVDSARLIGYEQRLYATEDDTVHWRMVGGAIGSGQQVTALYELVPQAHLIPLVTAPAARIVLQYQAVDDNRDKMRQLDVPATVKRFSGAGDDFQYAAGVALFGMLLHQSAYTGEASYGMAEKITRKATRDKGDVLRKDFLRLVKKAAKLSDPAGGTPAAGSGVQPN